MIKNHLLTSDEKTSYWGDGEWVGEPDEVIFTYNDIECKIMRVFIPEPYTEQFHMFGGHLCGYVRIPCNHPYYQKKYEDMDICCHYGLTYGECNEGHWIGFDCAHSSDYLPSTEFLKKTDKELIKISKEFALPKSFKNLSLFNPVYRNIDFCIQQCKEIVDQLIETNNKVNTEEINDQNT